MSVITADDFEDDENKFIPSIRRPLPTFPCTHVNDAGEQHCTEPGMAGLGPQEALCRIHIRGKSKDKLRERARAQIEAAKLRLTQDTDLAVETIESLMQPGTPDAIRLKAAETVLDRAGIRGGVEIDLGVEVTVNPLDEIKHKLLRLVQADEDEDDILEAEVVEDESQVGSSEDGRLDDPQSEEPSSD